MLVPSPSTGPSSGLRADGSPSYSSTLDWSETLDSSQEDLDISSNRSYIRTRRDRSSAVFQPRIRMDSDGRKSIQKSVVFQPRHESREKEDLESDDLGDAVARLVSGIHLVGSVGHRGRDIDVRVRESPRESLRNSHESPREARNRLSVSSPKLRKQVAEARELPELKAGQHEGREGPRERIDVIEVARVARVLDLEDSVDFCEESSVPSGAFVLETPQKYQIGRPPCMFGRSHVNILAHPNRYPFWLNQKCGLSPLAMAVSSRALGQKQFAHLFHKPAGPAGMIGHFHADPPGFMVLTGRLNKVPAIEDEDLRVPSRKASAPLPLEDLESFFFKVHKFWIIYFYCRFAVPGVDKHLAEDHFDG